jgi:hypothetical protein
MNVIKMFTTRSEVSGVGDDIDVTEVSGKPLAQEMLKSGVSLSN